MDERTSYKIKYKQKWDALEIRPNVSKLSRAMSETHLRKRVQFIKDWKAGKVLGGSRTGLSDIVKAYLLDVCDNSCPACGYAGLNGNGFPNLDMVHINDNPYDHSYGNIMPLCKNCHGEITVHGPQNNGKGRADNKKTKRDTRSKLVTTKEYFQERVKELGLGNLPVYMNRDYRAGRELPLLNETVETQNKQLRLFEMEDENV